MIRTALAAFLVAVPAAAQEGSTWNTRFDGGFRFESDDGQFQLRLRSRLHMDVMQADEDADLKRAAGRFDDGAEIRRARLELDGRVYEDLEYQMQLEFADQGVEFRTIRLSSADVYGLDRVAVGQFKEPMGQEQLASTNHILFLERALTSALVPGRNIGVGIEDQPVDGRLGFGLGLFQDAKATGQTENEGYSATARVFGTPLREDPCLLHLGASASLRLPDDEYQVRSRPESHLAPRLVDTGVLTRVDRVTLGGLEAAVVLGPCSVQSEYVQAWVDQSGGAISRFHAWTMAATWTLTGESRGYRSGTGTLSPVRPDRPLQGNRDGFGAVELKARYSHLDTDSGMVQGGTLDDYTFGINWIPNDWTRVMGEVVLADLEEVGQATLWQLRFQLAF